MTLEDHLTNVIHNHRMQYGAADARELARLVMAEHERFLEADKAHEPEAVAQEMHEVMESVEEFH